MSEEEDMQTLKEMGVPYIEFAGVLSGDVENFENDKNVQKVGRSYFIAAPGFESAVEALRSEAARMEEAEDIDKPVPIEEILEEIGIPSIEMI